MTRKLNIQRITLGLLSIIALVLGGGQAATAQTSTTRDVKNIVLVHGGFVDGSGWEGVYNALKKKGYNITIVQNPTISLADDVAVTKRIIAAQDGPVILVGHSYGGVVITEAGSDPKVAGLVYIAAFAPDKGESVASLIKDPPPGAPVPPILPPQDGFLLLDRAKFPAAFAADVRADAAAFMADSQVPWGVEALGGTVSQPAWRSRPSWYLVTTEDKMIPPDAQRAMSTYTSAEYDELLRLGKEPLVFVKQKPRGEQRLSSWENEEEDSEKKSALESFKRRACEKFTPAYFTTPDGLALAVILALDEWEARGRPGARKTFASTVEYFQGKNPAGQFQILDFGTTLLGREEQIRALDDFAKRRETSRLHPERQGRDWQKQDPA